MQQLTVMYKFVIPAQINNIMSHFETGTGRFGNVQIRQIIFGLSESNEFIYISCLEYLFLEIV